MERRQVRTTVWSVIARRVICRPQIIRIESPITINVHDFTLVVWIPGFSLITVDHIDTCAKTAAGTPSPSLHKRLIYVRSCSIHIPPSGPTTTVLRQSSTQSYCNTSHICMPDCSTVDLTIGLAIQWASYQIRKIAGCACAGNAGNVFPRRRFQRKPLVSYPGMHHGTCVTHVPWCMSGSLTCGDGENVPSIPGACATRNYTYLARGPWNKVSPSAAVEASMRTTATKNLFSTYCKISIYIAMIYFTNKVRSFR